MLRRRLLTCSFCGKGEADVAKLVAGPKVYICDRCVAIASRIMDVHSGSELQIPVPQPGFWQRVLSRIGWWHQFASV